MDKIDEGDGKNGATGCPICIRQSLLKEVLGCLPDIFKPVEKEYEQGYNDCRTEVNRALTKLFGGEK